MLYNDGETLDPLALCIVIQMKASQKNHCDSIIVEKRGKSGFECFPFLFFFVAALLSKSRNLISRPCKTIVSLTAI